MWIDKLGVSGAWARGDARPRGSEARQRIAHNSHNQHIHSNQHRRTPEPLQDLLSANGHVTYKNVPSKQPTRPGASWRPRAARRRRARGRSGMGMSNGRFERYVPLSPRRARLSGADIARLKDSKRVCTRLGRTLKGEKDRSVDAHNMVVGREEGGVEVGDLRCVLEH
jgi:hypothetical protein